MRDETLTVFALTTLTTLSLRVNVSSILRPRKNWPTVYWFINASVQVLAEISGNTGSLLWQIIAVERVIPAGKYLSTNSSYAVAVRLYALYDS
jgi:hypothetical protein